MAAGFTTLAALIIMGFFTGLYVWKGTPYSSYTLQAMMWLDGRLDLRDGEFYSWLELAIVDDKYFVSFPPFPSVIMLPFAAVFGQKTPDNLIAVTFGVISAVYAYRVCMLFLKDSTKSLFFSLFALIGSNWLHIAFWGSVWYIAQNMAFAFSLAAIYYVVSAKRQFALGLFLLACAVGCRPFQIIYAPVLLYMVYEKSAAKGRLKAVKSTLICSVPAACLGLIYAGLNWARFGNPLEFGHNFLPEFNRYVDHKQFSLRYILPNLRKMFFELPRLTDNGLEFPSFDGMALWVVSPLFFVFIFCVGFALCGKFNKKIKLSVLAGLVFVLAHLTFLAAHSTQGGAHFGNRYTVDALPFMLLVILYIFKEAGGNFAGKVKEFSAPLACAGVIINAVGTVLYFRR